MQVYTMLKCQLIMFLHLLFFGVFVDDLLCLGSSVSSGGGGLKINYPRNFKLQQNRVLILHLASQFLEIVKEKRYHCLKLAIILSILCPSLISILQTPIIF